jgi:hypothetical protein
LTNITTGQTKIATTGTLQQLAASGTLEKGALVSCPSTNTHPVAITTNPSGSTAVDGTGNSFIISAGQSAFFSVLDTKGLWVGGTSADVVSWAAI